MLRHVEGELFKSIWQDGSAFIFEFTQFKKRSRAEMASLCNGCTGVSRCVFCVEPLNVPMTRNFSNLTSAGLSLWVVRSVERMCLSFFKSNHFQHLQILYKYSWYYLRYKHT
jgi:hypothetical protein